MINKVVNLENGLIHVHFYSLPLGAIFLHKGSFYEKIAEERVKQICGREWVFEIHYGCLISEEQFRSYSLSEADVRAIGSAV